LKSRLAVLLVLFLASLFPFPVAAQATAQQDSSQQQADQLFGEGLQLYNAQDWQHALDKFNQALSFYRLAVSKPGIALSLLYIGFSKNELMDYQGAITAMEECAPLWLQLEEPLNDLSTYKLWTYNAIGYAYRALGQPEQSLDPTLKALAVAEEMGNLQWQEIEYAAISLMYDQLSQFDNELVYSQKLLDLQIKKGDLKGQANTLFSFGLIFSYLYQYDQSLSYFQQSLEIWRPLSDNTQLIKVYQAIGMTYLALGNYPEARTAYQTVYDLAQEAGDKGTQGWSLLSLGIASARAGDYMGALRYYQAGLTVMEETGDLDGQITAHNNMGVVYHILGDYVQAITNYDKTLQIANDLEGDTGMAGKALALNGLGTLAMDNGDLDKALDHYTKALAIEQARPYSSGLIALLTNIGLIYATKQDYDTAMKYYNLALDASLSTSDRRNEANVMTNIGTVYADQNKFDQAIEYYNQALTIHREIGTRESEAETLHNLADLYAQQGNDDEAIKVYQQATELVETIQQAIKVDELKNAYAHNKFYFYEELIDLLWKKGRFEEAFNYSEKARARAFLDQLAGGKIDITSGASAVLLQRQQAIREELTAKRDLLASFRSQAGLDQNNQRDASTITETTNRITALEKKYSQVISDLKLNSPETAAMVTIDVASLPEIQKLLSADMTLVEYYVNIDRTYIFIITANSLKTVSVQVYWKDLYEVIDNFRIFASLDDPYPDSLKKLYGWLVEPIKPYLSTKVIGIIPHGNLHHLPFAAITDGKQYFGEQYTLFALPSASALRFIHTRPTPTASNVLVLGNPKNDFGLPPLQNAEKEANAIANMYGSRALIGTQATKSALFSQANLSDIIHLAAHGEYNAKNPLFSTLYLAKESGGGGRLDAYEIYGLNLKLKNSLVVLSACQTQMGEVTYGDEIYGFVRAFLYSGASTVVASLWRVDDAATSLLMERFYTHLRQGSSKALALRQAQADVRAKYPNPYYWAAFVLTGDPGQSTGAGISTWLQTIGNGNPSLVIAGVCVIGSFLLLVVAIFGLFILIRKRKA
jgi:CHAT domain-containing protein/tetratricopeptide (TPR) repeat protein